MSESDNQIIERALGVIESTAGRGLAGQVELAISREGLSRSILAGHLRRAQGLAWFWQTGWSTAAVGWLLAKLVRDFDQFLMSGSPVSDKIAVDGLFTVLAQMSEQQLQSGLAAWRMTGARLVTDIGREQQGRSRHAWDPAQFSNPEAHNPSAFQYLVHALRPTANIPKGNFDQVLFRRKVQGYFREGVTSFTLESARLYLTDPTVLRQEILSCSVIDARHCETYGGFTFGFILRAPKENIVYASIKDFATDFNKTRAEALALLKPRLATARITSFLDELRGMYTQPLLSPVNLLRRTRAHNEVIVLGSLGGAHPVRARGIFVKVSTDLKLWRSFLAASEDSLQTYDSSLIHWIKRCSTDHDIPIVPIPGPQSSGDAASPVSIYSAFGDRVRPTRSGRRLQQLDW